MLKASVGLSRKTSREYQSTGYSINLDGEIPFGPDDAEGVLEKIQELYALAREAVSREIERDQSDQAGGQRHEAPPPPTSPVSKSQPKSSGQSAPLPINRPPYSNGSRPSNSASSSESATPKQVQYLLSLGKRKGLSREDLDAVIAQVVGSPKKTGELSKREAGSVIDHLTKLEPEATA